MEAAKIDTGDTAWLLVSTALVLLMTPGLALFYGGMVRTKNVLSTIMHSIFALGLVTVAWVTVGYTLAFGSDIGGVIGGFDYLFLSGRDVFNAEREQILRDDQGLLPSYAEIADVRRFGVVWSVGVTGKF